MLHSVHMRTAPGIKRAYERPSAKDGLRILVDGLWPRGLTKEGLKADLWLRDIAPSKGLREWFGHEPGRWPGFRRRYFAELAKKKPLLEDALAKAGGRPVTFVYGARDEAHNNAVVLAEFAATRLGRRRLTRPAAKRAAPRRRPSRR